MVHPARQHGSFESRTDWSRALGKIRDFVHRAFEPFEWRRSILETLLDQLNVHSGREPTAMNSMRKTEGRGVLPEFWRTVADGRRIPSEENCTIIGEEGRQLNLLGGSFLLQRVVSMWREARIWRWV